MAMRESIGRTTPSQLEAAVQLLPTPNATDSQGGPRKVPERRTSSGPDHGPRLRDVAPLLKTPTAQLAVNGGSQHPDKRRAGGHGPTLADQVECELLPTPRATDGAKWGPNQRGQMGGPSLPTAIDLLPTPRASDTGTPGRRASEGFRPPLSQVLLPTPTAQAAKHAELAPSETRPFDDSNLWVVATRIGERTPPRLHAGKPSPDAPHPRQLSLDELDSD